MSFSCDFLSGNTQSNVLENMETYSCEYIHLSSNQLIDHECNLWRRKEKFLHRRKTNIFIFLFQTFPSLMKKKRILSRFQWIEATKKNEIEFFLLIKLTPNEKIIALDWLRFDRPHAPAILTMIKRMKSLKTKINFKWRKKKKVSIRKMISSSSEQIKDRWLSSVNVSET